jgi:seryl-tRNA synthetase
MLDIKFIRQNTQLVKEAVANKKAEKVSIDDLLALDDARAMFQCRVDELNRKRNLASKEKNIEEGRNLKEEAFKVDEELKQTSNKLRALLYKVPNVPTADTPLGFDESGNKVLRKWGDIPEFDFQPRDHLDLGVSLGVIDTETAGKVSGSRLYYIKGKLVLLEFALVQFAFSVLTNKELLSKIVTDNNLNVSSKPFVPVIPPVFIKLDVAEKMARKDPLDDRYVLEKDGQLLVGSAEHTLGPMHMDQVFDEKSLPIRYVGFSTSFRREAGSYGKDTRGIIRSHQFDKLEMETFTIPELGLNEQDFLISIQEYMMQMLGIPYQVVIICTGDMGTPDARQLDIESYMPGEGKYRETHSSDYMTDYQARRLGTRVRVGDRTEFVHMNDATVFAVGRILVAIMENYQQSNGSIKIPEVLRKFTIFDEISTS